MAKTKSDILKGPVAVQILLFFLPVLLGSFLQQLYNTVDAMVVGQYVGKEALAAVGGSTGTLLNLFINFIVGLASGATVIIAQCYGRRDYDGVRSSVRTGMFLAVGMGFVMMAVGLVLAPNLLRMLNVPEDVFAHSLTYIRIYFLGFIPTMIYNMGASVLRAVGDSKRPLYFLIAACITNIFLDLLCVARLGLGVVGVGIATVCSQLVSCILTMIVLGKTEDSYHFEFRDFGFEFDLLKRIIVIGLPIGIQSVMYSISNLFIQASVNGFGTDTVAAYTAFSKLDAFFWIFSSAFGTACMTIVGQNFGAGNIERVKKAIRASFLMETGGTIVLTLVLVVFGNELLGLFTDDPNVLKIGYEFTVFMSKYWITFIPIEIFSCSIRACGESMVPMFMTAFGVCGIRIAWLLLFPYSTVIEAVYCYPISWIFTSILFTVYYLRGSWLSSCIERQKVLVHENG